MLNKYKDLIVFFLALTPSFLVFFYFKHKGFHIVPLLMFWVVPASIGITIVRIIWGEDKFINFTFPGGRKRLENFNKSLIIVAVPLAIIFALIIDLVAN